jgi:hypothetical protein
VQERLRLVLVAALVGFTGACAHLGPDVATIEGGEIYRIDGKRLPKSGSGPFELKPGGHTFEATAQTSESFLWVVTYYKSGLRTLCLKARGGHRYEIKATVKDGDVSVFIVDRETGKPPLTPCGPDEDED